MYINSSVAGNSRLECGCVRALYGVNKIDFFMRLKTGIRNGGTRGPPTFYTDQVTNHSSTLPKSNFCLFNLQGVVYERFIMGK